ncbi:hypothetical protein BpHYR1_004820 [Brachionus plicatilis]|uniref:Uncharacterized protein n=1 Tax=Brachionus plicatilis TaxID=10195 RepID=A0A3M7RF15_BRAPC|nr:hypothetical protein BpHYR1_004820 [Brachionus plicatilis]
MLFQHWNHFHLFIESELKSWLENTCIPVIIDLANMKNEFESIIEPFLGQNRQYFDFRDQNEDLFTVNLKTNPKKTNILKTIKLYEDSDSNYHGPYTIEYQSRGFETKNFHITLYANSCHQLHLIFQRGSHANKWKYLNQFIYFQIGMYIWMKQELI